MLFDRFREWLIDLLQPPVITEPCFVVNGKELTRSEIFKKIAAPLTCTIKTKSMGGATMRYITARNVMDRLDEVCPGLWEFRVEFVQVPAGKGGQYVAKGSLTICGVTREDTGMNDNQDAYDPAKAATSDALKRCAVQFGFARELYDDSAPKKAHWSENPAHWRKFETWFSDQPNISMDQVYELLGNDPRDWPDANTVKAQIEAITRPF